MQFTNTIWLWGLTALAVPIAIHLLSRKEGKVIRVGSVRHLEETNTKQFKSLRLNEVLLLCLRCAIIALLVALLAGLYINASTSDRPKWLVIEHGLENDKDFASLTDSLSKQGFVKKQLAAGFPAVDSAISPSQPDYWTLADRLGQHGLEQAVVLSYNRAAGFRGGRGALPANVKWISKDAAPKQFLAYAVRSGNDSLTVRQGSTSPAETSFTTTMVAYPSGTGSYQSGTDSITIHSPDTINIALVSSTEFAYDKNIVLAGLQAVDESVSARIAVRTLAPEAFTPGNDDWIIWLSRDGGSEKFQGNRIVLGSGGASTGSRLMRQTLAANGMRQWEITQRLNESVALQQQLPLQLADILLDRRAADKRADLYDQRALPTSQLWSTETNASIAGRTQHDSNNSTTTILTIVLLLTVVAERTIALQRNQ